MATASSNATTTTAGAGENSGGSNVPQWKRDLIQRRRQQNKVFSNDSGGMKFCSGISTTTTSSSPDCEVKGAPTRIRNITKCREECGSGISRAQTTSSSSSSLFSSRESNCGAITGGSIGSTDDLSSPSVACNMRLEADLSLCSSLDLEHVLNSFVGSGSATPNKSVMEIGRNNNKSLEHESEDNNVEKSVNEHFDHSNRCDSACDQTNTRREMFGLPRTKTNKFSLEIQKSRNLEDPESDSSEELQYGPGIVNKLKSKYLNLTLREMNKSRTSVQRFRRAASLEDLLDCDEDSSEKTTKRYTKRNNAIVTTVKTDRYRNTSRGNDTMKRARSVETLMRYNAASTAEECSNTVVSSSILSNRFVSTTNGARSEVTNDHIILIDRTSIKIENRLEIDNRPKAINKPKRIRPVLAETERPPPDLVKTTMRIFEGSTKKLRPKGEVAAKVATFKTINDTFKAQTQKKILVPKPPLQPKPFTNGNSRPSSIQGSPVKKIILPQKPTAELIENDQEEFHIEGVETDPIVQSVSLVVSKFQQIEKSHSPSLSPEPTSYKLRFSPAPSPEPQHNKSRSSPAISSSSSSSSPRVSSPRIQSPPSKDPIHTPRQNSSPVHKLPTSSSSSPRLNSSNVPPKAPLAPVIIQESKALSQEQMITTSDSQDSSVVSQESIHVNSETLSESSEQNSQDQLEDKSQNISSDSQPEESETSCSVENDTIEDVDGPKTISKSALENINKAGITMQFTFSDKSSEEKDYLPGSKQNGKRVIEDSDSNDIEDTSLLENSAPPNPPTTDLKMEPASKIQEKEHKYSPKIEDTNDLKPSTMDNNKQIGAISSLGLVRSSTTTSYPQNNETKTIRSQKIDSPSPPQKQIGIIRPLVSTKTQLPQQNLSDRELEKNLINRVKSIEQPTKVVVSLKSAEEIQPLKKSTPPGGGGGGGGIVGGGGGLWDTKPWNQHNNTMVFNFSNRRDVPDYIENDGLIIRRKREKPKVGDGGIIVLDATLDASTTDDSEWEISVGPPSPCDVSFLNDNVLINGRSNLSRQPRNHQHRIQFDDSATRTFEYPSEASMLEGESSTVDGETTSCSVEQPAPVNNTILSSSSSSLPTNSGTNLPSLLGGCGLANYTPSKVDLTSEGFELGVTRTISSSASTSTPTSTSPAATSSTVDLTEQIENVSEVDYLKPAQDAGAWGSETTGDLLY